MARLNRIAGLGLIVALAAPPLHAQNTAGTAPASSAESAVAETVSEQDLTIPPTISSVPGETRLETPDAEREDALVAVVTSNQAEFRLPDLGTELREERERQDPNQRVIVNPIRLYDPERDTSIYDNFLEPDVLRDLGRIEIFRIQLGGNPAD